MIRNIFILIIITAISACNSDPEKPNIILIMGDDIGYSDIGCYGSEIRTPNLDMLAEEGMRFQAFYNMSKCETSRTTLLTGLYFSSVKAVNVAKVLKSAGYNTIHSGKEHFTGKIPESFHAKNAFDRSFTFWANNEYFVPPGQNFQRPFYLNGKEMNADELGQNNPDFYKTDVVTDYAIEFLEEFKNQDKPFFLYVPYNAAHYPLQAMPADIEKYKGTYDKGWDDIRKERYHKMQLLGILDESYILSKPTNNINRFRGHPKGDPERRKEIPLYRPWESLKDSEKEELALEMNVFAAIIDRMDQNIGRIIKWLKENDEYDNSLIMYLSDNGSCPYDNNRNFDIPPGPPGAYRTLCAAWANVGNTPFRFFKQFGHEGGARTHFIAHWPDVINPGTITSQPGHIIDLYPTFVEIAGAKYPDSVNNLQGSSLFPIFKGLQREDPEYFISGFQERFRMFRKGEWKIVRSNDDPWELYNMVDDPTEIFNLADSIPEKSIEMEDIYLEVYNSSTK